MASEKDFMHLPLPLKEDGRAFYRKPVIPPQVQTAQNQQNRQMHGGNLKRRASELSSFWNHRRNERKQQNLPTIEGGIPFLLQIDPSTDVGFLYGLGFEVVCDLDDGFILVAAEDKDLNVFQRKVDDFISNKNRSGSAAKIYGLCGDDDRLERVLSKTLYEKWSLIDDAQIFTVDISIECNGLTRNPDLPEKSDDETEEQYFARCQKAKTEYFLSIDEIAMKRQEQFEAIVLAYNNNQGFEYIDDVDSFSTRISINGRGLRDLVQNFGYIFEVSEAAEVRMESALGLTSQIDENLIIHPPAEGSPTVCVIDSGIQENHKYLAPAILSNDSECYVPNETSVNDEYGSGGATGGHGTRVAGAVLYPKVIPETGNITLPVFIRNARVLDKNNHLPIVTNPSKVIEDIVKRFYVDANVKTKIFNHSIGEGTPFDGEEFKHMSYWAAKIDELTYDYDVLFIQSAGNISEETIRGLISALDKPYPLYFDEKPARLSNPAQSLQALTVGSVSHSDYEDDDYAAIGKSNEISSFSRIGPGIWDSIKPDVVEYGGTHIINKRDNTLTTNDDVCPDLIRTSPIGPAHARDGIGTSFAAPKVAHIAAAIQNTLPFAPALLYRALIAQSARLPEDISRMTTDQKQMLMRQMGYGVPDLNRATENNDYRATFVTTDAVEIGAGEAHIYPIFIPDSLRSVGDDYNILVEITLSYSAKPKRTRRGIRHYMSTWLDWKCSQIGETEEIFKQRVFETDKSIQDDGTFKWVIRERNDWGDFRGFNRKGQTLQKDWCVVKSSQLNAAFCVAVRAHKGWGSLFKAKYALTVSFEAIDQDIEIYEQIRINNQINVEVEAEELRVEVDDFVNKG